MKKIKYVLLFAFCCHFIFGQESTVEKSFLILYSGKSYTLALDFAKKASAKLNLELNLRDLYPKEEVGLSSDEVCGCGEMHGYLPRGRFDDGSYVSIEFSDAYQGFSQGYYMVVVSSGNRNDVGATLKKVKPFYTDAYIKNTAVYMGCMH